MEIKKHKIYIMKLERQKNDQKSVENKIAKTLIK